MVLVLYTCTLEVTCKLHAKCKEQFTVHIPHHTLCTQYDEPKHIFLLHHVAENVTVRCFRLEQVILIYFL